MRHAGLNQEQMDFLRIADLSELRLKIKAEFTVAGEAMSIVTICAPTICMPTPTKPPPPTPNDSAK